MWAMINSLHSKNAPKLKSLLLAAATSLLRQILTQPLCFQDPALQALPVLHQIPQDLTLYLLQFTLLFFLWAN